MNQKPVAFVYAFLGAIVALGLGTACSNDQVTEPSAVVDRPADIGDWWQFEKPTEQRFAAQRQRFEQMSGASASTTSSEEPVTWTMPAGWQRLPNPRFAFAALQTVAGLQISLTISGGSELSNLNRWRGQFSLPILSDVPADYERVTVLGHEAVIMPVQGTMQTRAGSVLENYQILGIMTPWQNRSLVIKVSGPLSSYTEDEHKTLRQWLASLEPRG